MTDFQDRLHRAADDSGIPLHTDVDALLDRARTRRRQARVRTLTASVVAAAVLVGTPFAVRAALGDDPADSRDGNAGEATPDVATDPTASAAPEPLTPEEIVERCRPQLAKFAELPMYPDAEDLAGPLVPLHQHDYVVGDLVSLVTPTFSANPVLCRIPAEDAISAEVTFADLVPTDGRISEDRVLELCSEGYLPRMKGAGHAPGSVDDIVEDSPDLRDGTVRALTNEAPMASAVITVGEVAHTCFVTPYDWDLGSIEVAEAPETTTDPVMGGAASGVVNKSISVEAAAWYHGAGRVTRDAATVELVLADGSVHDYDVTDGWYAVLAKGDGSDGLLPVEYRLLAADGSVLAEGTSLE